MVTIGGRRDLEDSLAIKKLRFTSDGLVEEKEVDKKTPVPVRQTSSTLRTTPKRSTQTKAKPAKIVEKIAISGKNPESSRKIVRKVEDLVDKVRCPKCGSERVVTDTSVKLSCGLCGAPMKPV